MQTIKLLLCISKMDYDLFTDCLQKAIQKSWTIHDCEKDSMGSGCHHHRSRNLHYPILVSEDPARHFLNHNVTGWGYTRGYFAGMGWAKTDLEEGRALILGPGSLGGPLDQGTGLYAWELDCVRDHGMDGVVDGYNRIVRLWVCLKGPPSYSRKRWKSMLFHLTEYFKKRVRPSLQLHLLLMAHQLLLPTV